MQQAVLFLTDKTSDYSLDAFDGFVKEAAGLADVFLVFHKKEDELPLDIRSRHPFVFTSSILYDLGYVPIGDSILPGNNHYPLFYFYKCHSNYNYYWIVEDDVRYTGNWHDFLMAFDDNDADFLSANVTRYPQDQYWYWWHTLETGASEIQKSRWIHSFNPIYRLSSRAITAIDHLLCSGWRGHHEVVLPTAVSYLGMKIEDFGGDGEFVSLGNENRFYDSATMDCRAVEYDPSDKNKLYHPVKEEKGISDTSRLKPNCIIISAGKDSLHRELFEGERDFDVHLLVFDDSYNKHCNDTDFIVAMSGYKMDMTYRYLQRHPEYLSHYEYFFLMDDDIRITTASVNRLFQLMREYSLRIAQPSLVLSYYTYEHTLHNPACKLRYTNFVEMMVPCFSCEALVKVLPTFEEKVRWRGIEFHWAKLIQSNKHDMAIVDDVVCVHTKPISSWSMDNDLLTKHYIKDNNLSRDICVFSSVSRESVTNKFLINELQSVGKISGMKQKTKRIVDYLLLYSPYMSDIGLYHGKMGIVVALYKYATRNHDNLLSEFAWDLFQQIYEAIHSDLPVGLEYGLAGIGFGTTLLYKYGLVDCDLNAILVEIDSKIMERSPLRIKDASIRTGLGGIMCYIALRRSIGEKLETFDERYLTELEAVSMSISKIHQKATLVDLLNIPDFSIDEYMDRPLGLDGGSSYYILKDTFL